MPKYDYDIVAIGGGAAGFTGAKLAAGFGKSVAMIEKNKLGGECTWFGCIPSKALLQSAKAAHMVKNIETYGISLSGNIETVHTGVMGNVRRTVQQIYQGHPSKAFEKLGITTLENAPVSFVDNHTIEFNGKRITSDKFLISTGSRPLIPPVKGIEEVDYKTNDTIFDLDEPPESLTIMGAGPIGVELASAFSRLGTSVTLIEMTDRILIKEDAELVQILSERLQEEGVRILTGCTVSSVSSSEGIQVQYLRNGEEESVVADELLVAAGRRPNLDGLSLDAAGVTYDSGGISVNGYLQSSSKNIYAAGDSVGPYLFSHMAGYQAVVAVMNALLPIKRKVRYDNVPWCTFTEPELARSGLTEDEATEKHGDAVSVYSVPYSFDRAKTDKSDTGLAKFVCGKRGKILGVHVLGERAGELMQEVHLAKAMGIPLYKLASVIHAYPTYTDVIRMAARDAYVDRIQANPLVRIVKSLRGGPSAN